MTLPIIVETLIPAGPNAIEIGPDGYTLESYKRIDHNNSSDRKWLGNHCFWAMRNGRKIVTYPA